MGNCTWHLLVQIRSTSSILEPELVFGLLSLVSPLFSPYHKILTDLTSQHLPFSSCDRNRSLRHSTSSTRTVCPHPSFPPPAKRLSAFPPIFHSRSTTQKTNGFFLKNSTTSTVAPWQHVSKTHRPSSAKPSTHLLPAATSSCKTCVSRLPTTGA
jgi:hypothetical protein